MYTAETDKVIAIQKPANDILQAWLADAQQHIRDTMTGGKEDTKNAERAISRLRAISQVLSPGFGNAARVTLDGERSLFVMEFPTQYVEQSTYVFGCIHHADDTIGVHS
jgi:DNA-binding MurR/RpiR family transcriptional regulator